jgi:excisionase family DNA binding protein
MTTITPETQTLLLTVNHAAKLLSVHPTTIRRWIRELKLPRVLLPGGSVRVRAADITAIADRREVSH